MLSQDRLQHLLKYDLITGFFYWRVARRGIRVGDRAGTRKSGDYWHIRLDGRLYLAHRLAWLYVHGRWPKHCIDHINRTTSDNRIENLREATLSQNHRNCKVPKTNTSGHKGVGFRPETNRWRASISTGQGKKRHLGYFKTKAEAIVAYELAAKKHYGDFACLQHE